MAIYNLNDVLSFTYYGGLCPYKIKEEHGVDRISVDINDDIWNALNKMLKTYIVSRIDGDGLGDVVVDVKRYVRIGLYSHTTGKSINEDVPFFGTHFYPYDVTDVKMVIPEHSPKTAHLLVKFSNIHEPSKYFTFVDFMTPLVH